MHLGQHVRTVHMRRAYLMAARRELRQGDQQCCVAGREVHAPDAVFGRVGVAGMLVVRAVRGRPVGWQPVCRRCKHDLRGVDNTLSVSIHRQTDLPVRQGGHQRLARMALVHACDGHTMRITQVGISALQHQVRI